MAGIMGDDITVSPSELIEIIKANIVAPRELSTPLLITGAPGIGKSACCDEAIRQTGADESVWHPVVDDAVDYKGIPVPGDDGWSRWQPPISLGVLTTATKRHVVRIEDFGQAEPGPQKATMQLLWSDQLAGVRISPEIRWLMCTNRRQDKAGVTGIIAPVIGRSIPLNLKPSEADWIEWALDAGLRYEIIAYQNFHKGASESYLYRDRATNDIENEVSPRGWELVDRVLKRAGYTANTLRAQVVGCIGRNVGLDFCTFLALHTKMPNPQAVIMAPEDPSSLPAADADQNGILFMLAGALGGMATQTNIGALLRYAEVLVKHNKNEVAMVLCRMAHKHDARVVATSEWIRATNTTQLGALITGSAR